jgi:septal ring factor EnvC (AmiA/AmiB activator)
MEKNEETSRKGKALVAVSVTEKQKNQMKQYDDDSAATGSSLEAMDSALDELSSDVRELGRCLKQTTFAASQLQKVQVKINTSIKNMLRREKGQ